MIAFLPVFDRTSSLVSAFSQASVLIKIGIFFMVWIGLWVPIAVPISFAVGWKFPHPLENQQKIPLVLSLYCLAPVVLFGISWADNVAFSTYGFDWNLGLLRSLLLGFASGAIGIAILFGVQMLFGWVNWQSENWRKLIGVMVPIALLGLFIGGIEELIFRGFLFGQSLREFGFWESAIASSVIFSVLHLVWEGRQHVPQLPGLALMGVVLCLAFSADRGSIGLAWGLHAGWIWAMASLDAAGMVKYAESAPEWAVGLDRKPLAGLMGLLFLLGTGILVVVTLGVSA